MSIEHTVGWVLIFIALLLLLIFGLNSMRNQDIKELKSRLEILEKLHKDTDAH